jgi:hypothetical protein
MKVTIKRMADLFNISWNTAYRILVDKTNREGFVEEFSDLGKRLNASQNPITGRIYIDSEELENLAKEKGIKL